jgi:hypothetical protein
VLDVRGQPASTFYRDYLKGLNEVVDAGSVAVSPETHQCMFTNEGLHFVSQRQDLQKYDSVYVI